MEFLLEKDTGSCTYKTFKMTLMEMNWWWRLQSDLAIENLENVINKIVPIPSSHAPD